MARIIPRRTWRRDAAHALSKWVIGCVVGLSETDRPSIQTDAVLILVGYGRLPRQF